MTTLAIDATTDRLSVALRTHDGRVAEREVTGVRRHASTLLPTVADLLAIAGLGVPDLAAVLISDGPGSFTGLRVAAAVAKSLGRALGIPLHTASTLLVRAAGQAPLGAARTILAVGGALRGEAYLALYRLTLPGSVECWLEPRVAAPAAPPNLPARPDVIVGDLEPAEWARWPWVGQAPYVGPPAGLPSARELFTLLGIQGGLRAIADPARWEPFYGRPAEAQARWERAHGRPLSNPDG